MKELAELAKSVRSKAYAPYSNHPVGAALIDENGNMFSGCNVENAAYPLGQCAEGNAIAAMVAGGGRRIAAIAVIGPGDDFCPPCGGCRQKIAEFSHTETRVQLLTDDGREKTYSVDELLPHSFGPQNL